MSKGKSLATFQSFISSVGLEFRWRCNHPAARAEAAHDEHGTAQFPRPETIHFLLILSRNSNTAFVGLSPSTPKSRLIVPWFFPSPGTTVASTPTS